MSSNQSNQPTYWQSQLKNASEFAADVQSRINTNSNQNAKELARIQSVDKKYLSLSFRSRPELNLLKEKQ